MSRRRALPSFPLIADRYVEFSRELWDLMAETHRTINAIPYATDEAVYGQKEHWSQYIDKMNRGDCDDYSLTKRRVLIEKGVPWQCLCPATLQIAGGGHFVMMVRTTAGVFVLDNNLASMPEWTAYRIGEYKPTWWAWFSPTRQKWFRFGRR
jgi:predicted transglutaminase-like cysteine proteinase